MSSSKDKTRTSVWFPTRRFDPDYPLVYWFTGLWLYLKSFLYLCYVYMLGLEPQPHPTAALMEVFYFGGTFIPCLLLGMAFWNEKKWVEIPALIFLVVDTPMFVFHVLRMAEAGHLDSGLTKALEFGSLLLNMVALSWLIGYRFSVKTRTVSRG